MSNKERKYTILVDFDGVLHSYTSGWQGAHLIPDPPVEGAIEWLNAMLDTGQFDLCIYSSRSKFPEGVEAMKAWLTHRGFARVNELQFPTEKPAAYLTIDDRCICFRGIFPKAQEMIDFKPWYKMGVVIPPKDMFTHFVEGNLRAMLSVDDPKQVRFMIESLLRAM